MRLGDVVRINPESIPKAFRHSQIEYIDISSVGTGSLSRTTRYEAANAPARARRLVRDGDTILATVRPNLRSFLYIKDPRPNLVVSTGFAVLRPRENIDPKFLYYTIAGQAFTDYLVSRVKGAAYPAVDVETIADAEISLPPLPIQRRISQILSTYDDLIENNLRRIAILEEIVQAIYREWFVEFRYPGHEDVSMVDSELGPIPDGWNVTSFSDVADVLSGGTPRTSVQEYWGGDIPFFTPKDSGGSFWAIATERTITRLGLDNCNSQLYPKETIFITARGTVGKVALSSADMAVNQSCYALRSKDGVSQYFVFLALRAEAATLRKQAHGAVFDTITMDTFDRLRLAVPPEHLLDSWDSTVGDMMQLSLNLSLTNLRLGETRDLLLPRLISGELDVSDIAISTVEDNL